MLKRVSLGRLTTLLLVLSLGPFTVLASDTTPTDTPQLTIASSSEQRIENKPLIIANSKAWKPYSFLDKTGQPTGILVDLWKAYGAANNLDVEFSLVDWSDSIDITRQGKADIHAGLLWSPERAEFLTYGGELFEIDTQLYFHQTLQSFNANTFLLGNHNYKVGVVRGGYEAEYMRSQFPSVDLVYFDNNELMIKAARARNILAFVADLQVANYYLHTSSYSGQFIGVKHLYSGYLHYAIGGEKCNRN
ncbi:extracellular solute-binding protein family 3/GGDEF domain protein [Vibrio maritimus]|uniref:Extracellular solute-binding protein family 3/GGDEF domain protein n=1 Tax=Vibrio maritimus TaxID=990268 RepID=A0A090RTV3_9VIBR|nr:extracellular solute-binding protein family 3/GGDEF domain protein [Vibrio maritimus]